MLHYNGWAVTVLLLLLLWLRILCLYFVVPKNKYKIHIKFRKTKKGIKSSGFCACYCWHEMLLSGINYKIMNNNQLFQHRKVNKLSMLSNKPKIPSDIGYITNYGTWKSIRYYNKPDVHTTIKYKCLCTKHYLITDKFYFYFMFQY